MPLETSVTVPAPTRRSLRSATVVASASTQAVTPAVAVAEVFEAAPTPEPLAPLSRREVRQQATAREVAETEAAQTEVFLDQAAQPQTVAPVAEERVPAAAVVGVAPAPPLSVSTQVAPVEEEALASSAIPTADVFEMASRLFEGISPTTASTPVTRRRTDGGNVVDTERERLATSQRRGARFTIRKIATAGVTAGVMGLAGMLAVSMTLPSQAVAAAQGGSMVGAESLAGEGPSSTKVSEDEIQAFVAPTSVQNESLAGASGFSTISRADLAAEQGIRFSESLYTNDPTASIQWPYVVGVAMSSPYGERWGQLHAGIDLVPGDGAPIQAIADGVVRLATESDGGYGVAVYIDHVIDGELITSHYAHMQYGSLRVATGEPIKVGDIIGLTGNTGRSYGAHLHFELLINDTPIDPLPWMMEHAGRK